MKTSNIVKLLILSAKIIEIMIGYTHANNKKSGTHERRV